MAEALVAGGAYKVGDDFVNADGKPLEGDALAAAKKAAGAKARAVKSARSAPVEDEDLGDQDKAELDASLFTPAALKKAQDLKMVTSNFARRKKTAGGGTTFGVEDVERIHAATDDGDDGVE